MTTPASPASTLLLSSEHWSELQALDVMRGNLMGFMGKLNPAQQKDYLRLCGEHVERESALSLALGAFYRDLDQQLVNSLEAALKLKTGKPLNARTTFVKTRIRQVPVPLSDLPDLAPDDPLSTHLHIFKQDLSVREYERSISLLEAAHRNFGFTAYFSTEEQNASFISDSALSVIDFVSVARHIDIGQQARDYIEKHFATRLSIALFALHSTKLLLALYDAFRTQEPWSISAHAFSRLRVQLSDKTLNWDVYQLDAGGEKIPLPFYTRRFETPDGPQVYSYFPDRPLGAFRRHFSVSEAVDGLQQQVRNEAGLQHFNWFMKVISLNNQEKIRTFIKPLVVNRDALYWHVKIFYDLFASKTPSRQKLVIEPAGVDTRSLLHALPVNLSWPIQSDVIRLARNTRLADREAATALLTYIASETLSLLLTPVPGGVTGLSKVMLFAALGTLTAQTVEAVAAFRQGRQAEIIQAVGDVFDLLVSVHLHGMASRLSTLRSRQLIRSLGYPKVRISSEGPPGLWFTQAYTEVEPTTLQGLEADKNGLYERNGQHYIRLRIEGQDKVAGVVRDDASGRYRLTHTAATYQPYVTYDAPHQRWLLDPIDTQALSDTHLLQQMLSPTRAPLSLNACRRAMQVAGVDREHLLEIWSGREAAQWAFAQAIEEQHVRSQLHSLQQQLKQANATLPPIAEQILPALLADLCRCTLSLYHSDGNRLRVRHDAVPATNERPRPSIELVQTDDGRYRTRAMASSAQPLLQHVLQEYERLNPQSTLGRTGHNAQDQHVENRLHELRKALSQHLGQHLLAVYQSLLEDQSRGHLSIHSAAYRFAPSSNSLEPSVALTLRRRFPGLSTAAADQLAHQHRALQVGNYAPIDTSARAAIHAHLTQSRITRALGALADPGGIGLDEHSQALFCSLLPLLPGWPQNVAVQVYQATNGPGGRMAGRGALLDTYGNAHADTFVMLVKADHRYAGYLQGNGGLQMPPEGENSLISATLRTLTDTQRDALNRGIYDRAGLVEDVLRQAHAHRAYLHEFLAPFRESALSSETLHTFRAFDMRQVAQPADADGVHRIAHRTYVNIDEVAYQVMFDSDASTPHAKVWRIVNRKDPVARDAENRYYASRSGETRAITRNAANLWVTAVVGALGGMRRTAQALDTKAFLLQRFVPIQAAFNVLNASGRRYDELLAQTQTHAADSDAAHAALIALEVHTLKHTRLQESYVTSLIENKDWLIHLKAGGLYQQELLTQQKERIDFLNKLMGIMDLRVRPLIEKEITLETCKKNLAHMNKKLKILEDRQRIVEQIRRLSRSDAQEMERINSALPGADKVQVTRFNVFNRLLVDDPNEPPTIGLNTAMAIHWVVEDLPNIPERSQPVALRLALEQIAVEKPDYAALLPTATAEQAAHINGILSIIERYELQIENRITQLHEQLASNQELPAYDQDIDFDFIPAQPAGSTEAVQPRKMFRVRRNGGYKVMVGVKETAPDGTVTVKVEDPFKEGLLRRYEKTTGEWQPVVVSKGLPARPHLVSEANALLSKVDEHLALARANEARKHYPTNIYEFLGTRAERLGELARTLESAAGDGETTALITRLKAGSELLMSEGRRILVRMYKNKDVLNVQRLDYLLDHAQLKVVRTVNRKQVGKARDRSFLDVYSINDAADNTPLWEAHFHYDRLERPALDYMTKGGHLKTLTQSRQGSGFQQREEQAGRAHQAIWREAISPKVAQKLFDRVH